MSDFNLPEGWVEAQLGEYLHLKNGYAFKSNSYVAKGNDTVPVIRISDIDGKLATDETAIHVKKTDVVGGFEIKKGDLLIAMSGATTGKVGVYNGSEPAYQNQRVGNLKLHSDVFGSTKFKDHLIASLTPEILKVAYGGAQPNISGKAIEEFLVALPPLAEQQQIAQKLDELLTQVDTLKTRLDAIPNILKRFRQSVLAAAVSGRLTEEWRGEKKLETPTDKALKEMIVTLDQGWSPKCLSEVGSDDDWAVIKTSSVQKVNFVKDENKKLPASFDARPELSLKKGDVLITRAGPRVRCGVTCLVTKDHPKLMICDKVYRIRTNSEVLMPEYLNFLFNSPQYLEVIEELKTGSSESGMNMTMKKLVEIILLIPSVVEQLEIIKLVEQLFAYADQIEQRVKDAQARVNHLTQSILAKAFRGELTADWREQNPELISGENSAAALLERIKAEREVVVKPKRKIKVKFDMEV